MNLAIANNRDNTCVWFWPNYVSNFVDSTFLSCFLVHLNC